MFPEGKNREMFSMRDDFSNNFDSINQKIQSMPKNYP